MRYSETLNPVCHMAVQAFLQSASDPSQAADSQLLPSTQPDPLLIPTIPRWYLSLPHSHSLLLILRRILSCFPVNTGTSFPNKLLLTSELLSHQDFLIFNSVCALSNKLVDSSPSTTLITSKAFKSLLTPALSLSTPTQNKTLKESYACVLFKQHLSGRAYRHSHFQMCPSEAATPGFLVPRKCKLVWITKLPWLGNIIISY